MSKDVDVVLLKQYNDALGGIEKHIDSIVSKFVELNKQAGKATSNLGEGAKNVKKEVQQADALAKKLEQQETKLNQLEDQRSVVIARNQQAIKDRNRAITDQVKAEKTASDSLVRMRQRLNELNKQYISASASARKEMAPAVNKLRQEIKAAEEATGDHRRSVGDYQKAMQALPGPIQRVQQAIQLMGAAMKTALGPIALIIAAVTGVVKAMGRSEEGANRLKRVMAVLSGAFGAILDVVTDFGIKAYDAIVTNPKKAINDLWQIIKKNLINRVQAIPELFTAVFNTVVGTFQFLGNKIKGIIADIPIIGKGIDADQASKGATDALLKIKEGAEDTGKALIKMTTGLDETQLGAIAKGVSNLGKEIKNDADESLRLAKVREDLLKLEREWSIERAKLQVQIDNARAALDDENISIEDKLRLNQEALELNDRIFEGENKLRNLRLSTAKEQADINASNTEALDEIARLETERIQAESEQARLRKRLLAEEKRLKTELAKSTKESDEEIIESDKKKTEEITKNQRELNDVTSAGTEAIDAIFNASTQNQLKSLQEKKDKGLISEEEFEKQREKIEKKGAERNKLINIGKISLEIALATAQLNFPKIAAATGALVAAIATPAYAMGTDYAEKRFLFGEAGHELGQKRDGSFFYANKPTLIDDASFVGAKIWNKTETDQILKGKKDVGFDDSRIVSELKRSNSKPVKSTEYTPEGIRSIERIGHSINVRLSKF